MLKLSDEAKRAYAKYVGPDGKLIIDDSLPDDMKEAFQFFNNKGINILEMNINDEANESDSDIELLEVDHHDDSFIEDDMDPSLEGDDSGTIIEDDSDVNLDDLNNLFN